MSKKLLLADDSVTIQKVVNLTFADEGIEVVTVGDGDSAVEQIAAFVPDLVMADVNMPGRSGYEVCELIKGDASTRHIPVILLVGSFEPFDDDEARRVGADDHMTKPFQSIRQLVNKVTDLLEGNAAPAIGEETVRMDESGTESALPSDADSVDPDTVEMEIPDRPAMYSDSGFDDEMIETASFDDFVGEPATASEPEPRSEMKDFAFVAETPSRFEPSFDRSAEPELEMTASDDFAGEAMPSETLESAAAYEPAYIEDAGTDDLPDSAMESVETVPEPADEALIRPYFAPAAPVSIDESNPLDLPPLVEETGIRPMSDIVEPEPVAAAPASAPAVMSEEMIAEITARVADKLAERIARALDSNVVKDVTLDVLKEIDQTKDLS